MKQGKIYLIPSPISDYDPRMLMPPGIELMVRKLNLFFVENIRTTRRYFSALGIKDIGQFQFEILDKDTAETETGRLMQFIQNGRSAGILSEAGCPGIADPGSGFISAAHRAGIQIIPLSGPSSIFLALMASGFSGQHFVFYGYLPIERKARKNKIREMELLSKKMDQTQIFMETPYRNRQLIDSLLENLEETTRLCLASDITGKDEFLKTKTIREWKKSIPDLHKKPTIFLISYH
jgi:16S rRNA (cytidine1402-2'-O)-methyltransferase